MRRMLLLLVLAVLAACGGEGGGGGITDPPDPDFDDDGILNGVDTCPNQAEVINLWLDDDGCPDDTSDFYNLIQQNVEAYWGEVFQASALVYTPIFTFQAYQVTASTPCGESPSDNAVYCPTNMGVYYHQPLLDSFWQGIGDASPAFIIAHEMGHHIGFLLRWFKPAWSAAFPGIPHTVISEKESELMADCFAGVWIAWVDALGLLEAGDLEEAIVAILAVADPDDTYFDPNAHGTDVQRVAAFAIGFDGGAGDCTSQEFFDLFPVPEK